jgi:hypothetical protein
MIIVTLVLANYGDYVVLAVFAAGAAWLAYGGYTGAIDPQTLGGIIACLLIGYVLLGGASGRRGPRKRKPPPPTPQPPPASGSGKRYSDAEFKATIAATAEKYKAEHQAAQFEQPKPQAEGNEAPQENVRPPQPPPIRKQYSDAEFLERLRYRAQAGTPIWWRDDDDVSKP